ncbi:arginine--tRNA ligase [archaeon]|nr:arginine--tRNA ligase [archaeon]
MKEFRTEVTKAIEKATNKKITSKSLSTPPDPKLGDLSSNIAFQFGGNPVEQAKNIASKIKPSGLIAKIETSGPYLNFFLDYEKAAKKIIKQAQHPSYGKSNLGKNKTLMIEYSQPNPNKPEHVGHLRNDFLGMALSNILTANNYKVIRANLINDRGIHICKAMLGYQKWGKCQPDIKPDHFVAKYYQKFCQEEAKHPKLTEEAKNMLKKWENKDPETIALWEKIVNWAYEGQRQTYALTGTEFDEWFYESRMYEKGREIVEQAVKKKIFKKEKDGSIVAQLKPLPNKVLVRSDGTTIYATNDLQLGKEKFAAYDLDKSIYVIGSAQNTYMKQLFKMFKLLGFKWWNKCYHLSYGMIYLPEGKMSSREGRVVYADDLLDEVITLAKKEATAKGMSQNIEETATQVGLAALKFTMLKTNHKKDITFDKSKSVSFEGDTGPYLQYAYARCHQIIEKLTTNDKPDYSLLIHEKEHALLKKISEFPEIIEESGKNYETHLIAVYLLELAHSFSEFYDACPVIQSKPVLRAARAELVKATMNTLSIGLALLGIQTINKM